MIKPYSLDDYVEEVIQYIKANGLKNPHVIAHSFGTRVALKTEYLYPNTFDRLVITGGAGLKPRLKITKLIKVSTFKVLKLFVKKQRLQKFYSPDYRALSPVMKESFIKIVNEHLDYTLPKIKNRTLIIFGKRDKQTPIYMAKRFNKRINKSSLTIIKGAGHFAFIDKPFKFNTEVKEFLLSK